MTLVQKFHRTFNPVCIYLRTVNMRDPMQTLETIKQKAAVCLRQGISMLGRDCQTVQTAKIVQPSDGPGQIRIGIDFAQRTESQFGLFSRQVVELAAGGLGQDEMGRRAALGAEMDFRVGVVLVRSAISSCGAVDAHFRRMKISPASAGFTAQCTVALIDVLRPRLHRDVDLTAKTGKRHRVATIARGWP